jgi:hypothetical protein
MATVFSPFRDMWQHLQYPYRLMDSVARTGARLMRKRTLGRWAIRLVLAAVVASALAGGLASAGAENVSVAAVHPPLDMIDITWT